MIIKLAVKGHSANKTGGYRVICHENVDFKGKPMELSQIFTLVKEGARES
jgi:hypothetical protein